MVSIRFVGVGARQSDDSFICFGAKTTQRACVRDLQRDRKKSRKGKITEENREKLVTVRERRQLEKGGC